MTTDDLIPPPPRIRLNVREIILGDLGTAESEQWSYQDMKNVAFNLSKLPQFENVIITLRVLKESWSYCNGYDRK